MIEEYLKHFPEGFSDEIVKYATDKVLKFSRYIFTHREKRQQYGYCTHCHSEFRTTGLKHNKETICPHCGSLCKVKASGMGRGYLLDEGYFVYYEKSEIDKDVMIARGIYCTRDYRYDYRNIVTECSPMYYYVFKMGDSFMFQNSYKWTSNGSYLANSAVKSKFNLMVISHLKSITYCRDSIKKAIEDTPFKYSAWEKYSHGDTSDMTEYFDLYSKYPVIEYVVKEGFTELIRERLDGNPTLRAVNWRANTIFKFFKIDKQTFKEIKAQKLELTYYTLKVIQDSKKNDWKLTIDEVKKIVKSCWFSDYENLIEVSKYASMRKMLNYFFKQLTTFRMKYLDLAAVILTYRDYINDCKKLKMKLDDKQNLFPKNLYDAHQNTIDQIKIKANKKFNVKIKERLDKLEKYRFEYLGLVIRAAESSDELIREGSTLHHCVGGYAERYAEGKTNIFFIRKLSELDKPYFTLELKNDVIIQVHGKDNCRANDMVNKFIEAFKKEKLQKKENKNRTMIA